MPLKKKAQLEIKDYFSGLSGILFRIKATGRAGKEINLSNAINGIVKKISAKKNKEGKVIIIGNGGSASIASHISTDFLKNARVAAQALNDSSLLTCISNDLGYEYVFQKPIEMLGKKGDILFSISSSGASKNILNATRAADKKKLYIITLSGFNKDNPLRMLGDINFYVPSYSYGYVEIAHLVICHAIVDAIIANKSQHG